MLEKILSAIIIICMCILPSEKAENTSYELEKLHYNECLTLIGEHTNNPESFTQGLFFQNGELYESTGLYGESKLYKNIDINTGKAELEYTFPDSIFAEGSVVFNDKLYVLTYKENIVQVFNPGTLELQAEYDYPRQGWGLTTDGKYLIASDGTSTLYFMDENLKLVNTVTVTADSKEISRINELEYIDGEIWANVWLTENILVIDPQIGKVKRIIDFSDFYKPESNDSDDVLNGIAYNPENSRLYITGKRWGGIFEFGLVR